MIWKGTGQLDSATKVLYLGETLNLEILRLGEINLRWFVVLCNKISSQSSQKAGLLTGCRTLLFRFNNNIIKALIAVC